MQRNIIVILCDQLRPDFLNMYGCGAIPTPNLDRLTAAGVVFDHAITASPVCAPARASMMTGLYPSGHGVWTNDVPFRDGLECLPQRMNDLGYATACFGKLHHFPATDAKGFAHVRQTEEDRLGAADPYSQWLKERRPEVTELWNWDPEKMASLLPQCEHHEYWLASETIAFLDAHARGDQPVFAWVSFQGPHDPLCPPAEVKGTVRADLLPRPIPLADGPRCPVHDYRRGWFPPPEDEEAVMASRVAYAECIVNIDQQIGRILDALARLGMFESTTFIFSADHGDLRGDFGLKEKGPFAYQGQLAVPLVVANDPRVRHGERSASLAGNIDIPSTVLDIAGDGRGMGLSRSLIDLAQECPERPRDVNFSEYGDNIKIVETQRHRFACYPFLGFRELYDRQADPQERANLAGRAEYAAMEIEFLQHVNDFAVLNKGIEINGFDLVPPLQAAIRRKHPRYDDPRYFQAAFPLNRRFKENLKHAGLDPNYTNWFRGHRILSHYGLDFEEL